MKKTIIQCVTAIICVVALGLTSSTAITKLADAKIQAADKQAEAIKTAAENAPVVDNGGVSAPVDSAAPSDPAAPADSSDPATPADPTAPADANGDAAASTTPATKAEILKIYNDAMNQIVTSKAGYTKKRTTNLSKLEGAEAIMKIKIAADAVNSFLGVGDTTYTNKKGKTEFLSKAALTEADVKSATCTEANGIYTINLVLADGKSSSPSVSDTSPLQRSGLFVGNADKSEYDYKSANNIYVGLNNADGASVQDVQESTSNAKITIKVDAKTGKVSAYNASWDWTAALTKVKYTIVTINGTGYATTSVAISNIQY